MSHEDNPENLDELGRRLLDRRKIISTVDGAKQLASRPAVVGLRPWGKRELIVGGKLFEVIGTPTQHLHEIAHSLGMLDGKCPHFIHPPMRSVGMLNPVDDFERFRELNVTAEMSGASHFMAKFPDPTLHCDFQKMVDAGNLVTIGSDWAFGTRLPLFPSVAPLALQIGVQRLLEMMTLNGARAAGKDEVRSIELAES